MYVVRGSAVLRSQARPSRPPLAFYAGASHTLSHRLSVLTISDLASFTAVPAACAQACTHFPMPLLVMTRTHTTHNTPLSLVVSVVSHRADRYVDRHVSRVVPNCPTCWQTWHVVHTAAACVVPLAAVYLLSSCFFFFFLCVCVSAANVRS